MRAIRNTASDGTVRRTSPVPLRLERVTPWLDDARWPMVYEISMGVRKDDPALMRRVETALARNRDRVHAILAEYGVPLVDGS